MYYYAGIGRRKKVPAKIIDIMTRFAERQAACDWILRSGGAEGSDKAFELGAKEKEIFKSKKAEVWALGELQCNLPHYMKTIDGLSRSIQNTLARNMMIILGKNGDQPVSFVLAYTDKPQEGGTSYGLRCAQRHKIPVFNLYDEKTLLLIELFLDSSDTKDFLSFVKKLNKLKGFQLNNETVLNVLDTVHRDFTKIRLLLDVEAVLLKTFNEEFLNDYIKEKGADDTWNVDTLLKIYQELAEIHNIILPGV